MAAMAALQPPERLTKYKIMAVGFFILAFGVYSFYLDILIPGLPDSSYREAVGFTAFLVPSFLLAGGQSLIGGFIICTTIPTVSRSRHRIRMWKSMALGSYLTFLFSLTYAAYPLHGPVYYAAFVGTSVFAILFEAAWAGTSIVSAGFAIRRVSGARWVHVLFAAGLSLLIIIVAAD
jgi:hypothetical protein